MTSLSIDYLQAAAHTPDDQVHGEISGRSDIRFWFEPGYYRLATADEIAWQFERLCPLLLVARMRAFYELRTRQEGRPVRPPSERLRPRNEAYERGLGAIHAIGEHDGVVFSAIGMKVFEVRIPDEVRALDEHAFCVTAGRAASEAVRSQFHQVLNLKFELRTRR